MSVIYSTDIGNMIKFIKQKCHLFIFYLVILISVLSISVINRVDYFYIVAFIRPLILKLFNIIIIKEKSQTLLHIHWPEGCNSSQSNQYSSN